MEWNKCIISTTIWLITVEFKITDRDIIDIHPLGAWGENIGESTKITVNSKWKNDKVNVIKWDGYNKTISYE